MEFEPVIGFEIHAQLPTLTKIFCGCLNDTGGSPNSRTCPVCLGLPGALPVLNETAVDLGLRVALALEANVSGTAGFARKNYFYPDLPKGYQITQHAEPLATGGHFDFEFDGATRRVRMRQIHIEEDAGKSVHVAAGVAAGSLVDLNRCGIPLVEIVTEPDIGSSSEADVFLSELRRLLVYLGATTGELHEGNLRFDTNISLRPAGTRDLGTQTEIKNLNSFKAVRRALDYEIERQSSVLEDGGEVVHETLLWDEASQRAVPVRSKEGASDYRYFPEPDLVDFDIDEARRERVAGAMPELPRDARRRLVADYCIPEYDASVLTGERETLVLFERAVAAARERLGRERPSTLAKTISNWIMVILGGYLNERGMTAAELSRRLERDDRRDAGGAAVGAAASSGDVSALAERLADVVATRVRGDVSEPAARRLFEEAMESPEPIDEMIDRLGIGATSDTDAVVRAVRDVLAEHPNEVERYRSGDAKLKRFFVGQVLSRTKGSADPQAIARAIDDELETGGTT